MSTHYQRVKSVFKERVLPHFPSAKERFKKYFKGSYDLLSFSKNSDMGMDFGLAVLGIKPLSTWFTYSRMKRISKLINEAGMEMVPVFGHHIYESHDSSAALISKTYNIPLDEARRGVEQEIASDCLKAWIYDPVVVSDLISRKTNLHVSPEEVKDHLAEFHADHELLGYPQPLPDVLAKTRALKIGSYSLTTEKQLTACACAISDTDSVVPSLTALASAAAVIEEISESSSRIRSFSLITEPRNRIGKIENGVIIKRTAKVGEWSVITISNLHLPLIYLPQTLLKKASTHMSFRNPADGFVP